MAKLTLQDMRDYDDAAMTLDPLRRESFGQQAVWLKLHRAGMYCRDMSEKALDDTLCSDDLIATRWWKRILGGIQ